MKIFNERNPRHIQILKEEIIRAKKIIKECNKFKKTEMNYHFIINLLIILNLVPGFCSAVFGLPLPRFFCPHTVAPNVYS